MKRQLAVWLMLIVAAFEAAALPPGFVYVDEEIPDVIVDLRYRGADNFLGQAVAGYQGQRAILSREATNALAAVQAELRPFGLGIKIFDAYRPQRAVDHFVRWAKDVDDRRMQARHYPHVDKRDLFREDYIAERSGHSRGSTLDLTLVSLTPPHDALEMGTIFDYFGPESWPTHAALPAQQRANRLLLQSLMLRHGFRLYPREWWHFTLNNEPYPETYFDFVVE